MLMLALAPLDHNASLEYTSRLCALNPPPLSSALQGTDHDYYYGTQRFNLPAPDHKTILPPPRHVG